MISRFWRFRPVFPAGLLAGLLGGLLVLGAWAAALSSAGPALAAELTVEVLGLSSDKGKVHFGLYDNPATFPDKEARIQGVETAIRNGRAEAMFRGLEKGLYAVAVFHDENGNGSFDQALFGIPLEDFGFSNGAKAFFGPPSFESAQVPVPAGGAKITIRVD